MEEEVTRGEHEKCGNENVDVTWYTWEWPTRCNFFSL